jgi:hypothetical protein
VSEKKRGLRKHYVIEWGVDGVKMYFNKQRAVQFTCELLQHGEQSVAVYWFLETEAQQWSYSNRSVEKYLKTVYPEDRMPYLLGQKADLFS